MNRSASGSSSAKWDPPGGWLLWAGAACVPAAYLLMPRRSKSAEYATDFDSFLRAPVPSASKEQITCTDFNSFLRVKPVEPCSTDFGSFLRDRGAPSPAPIVETIKEEVEEVPTDSAPVLVMYGTEYGFSQEIAQKLCNELKPTGSYWPTLINMADVPEGYDLSKEQVVLMCCSTQGDGVPPTEARDFCDWFTAGKAGSLGHLHYSVLALGDTSYTHFCRCGKSLDAAWEAAGAQQLAPRRDVDKEDWPVVDAWISAVVEGLRGLSLKTVADLGGVPTFAAAGGTAAAKGYSRSRPYYARVVAREGLCQVSTRTDKETIRVELDLGDSGLTYLPGDALGMYPTNNHKAVTELLEVLGASGEEAVPTPAWHYTEDPQRAPPPPAAAAGGSMTLRHALTCCYDLHSPKADQLLQLLLKQAQAIAAAAPAGKGTAGGPAEKGGVTQVDVVVSAGGTSPVVLDQDSSSSPKKPARGGRWGDKVVQLQQLLADKQQLEAYLAETHVVDILREYASQEQLQVQQLLPVLRPLQPRLYSISSTPLEQPYGVQVSVAVVRYETLGVEREGVCSTYLAERLEVGARVHIYISKNPDFRLPPDQHTPLIMVGPGTGLAPFRSFILHRVLQQQQQEGGADGLGPMVLYFGCRRRDQDYLYGVQLEQWAAEGVIRLQTAFSREGAEKVYVQDLLRQSGEEVWQLLEAGGHFYVCGDANSMAGAVEQTLLDLIQSKLPAGTREAALGYLEGLAAAGRYERDVWFS